MSGSVVRAKTAVITGAPGSGKTALIEELAARGLRVVPEAARAILREPGGMALRADDPLGFADAMLAREVADLKSVSDEDTWTIFDRGIGDSLGFLRLIGADLSTGILQQATSIRYSGPVFVAPSWKEIFHRDAERTQTWDQALASGVAVSEGWLGLGYNLIELPLTTLSERASFVEARLAKPVSLLRPSAAQPPSVPTIC